MFDEGALRHIRRHWAVFAGLAVALVAWGVVDVGRRAVVDPQRPYLHMTDLTVYTEAGAAFFDGREPYEVMNVRGWKYLYPPLFALLVAPLAALSPSSQALVFFAISVLLCLGSYCECRRILAGMLVGAPERQRFAVVLAIVAGATALFPTLNCLQRGQIGVVLLYPLLMGFRLVVVAEGRGAWFLGGLVLALPVVLKLTPVLPVGCLLLALALRTNARLIETAAEPGEWTPVRARRKFWHVAAGALTGGLLFSLLIPAGLIGWQANLGHLHTWATRVASKADHDRTDQFAGAGSTVRNQSLTNAVQRFGNWAAFKFAGGPDDRLLDQVRLPELGTMPMDQPLIHSLLLAARGLAGLMLLTAVIALGRRGDPIALGFALGLGCVATFVVAPVARGHYFLLYVPALLFGGLWLRQCSGEKPAFRFAAIPMLLCLVHYLALNHAGRIGLLGLGTALWFFAACGVVVAEAVRGGRTMQPEDAPAAQAVAAPERRAAA
jgi:hypothetical protein